MKRNGSVIRYLLSTALLLPLAMPTSVGPGRKRAPTRYGIPKLAPGQLWVSSVPVGLEVRIGERPTAKNVIGRTPLVLKARDVGAYVTVSIQKQEYGAELPNQEDLIDLSAKNTHSSVINYGTHQTDVSRALTYKVELPKKNSVIALFQTRYLSLTDLVRLYPPGSNFQFSDSVVQRQLASKGVPPDFIRAGIRLLHRGGKIALPGAQGWLIAEVSSSGQVELLEQPAKNSN
jgi:hypothetical protein